MKAQSYLEGGTVQLTGRERGWQVRRTLGGTLRNGRFGQLTRVTRSRQLRDGDMTGGNQPTDVRVIHRRNEPPAFPAGHVGEIAMALRTFLPRLMSSTETQRLLSDLGYASRH